MKAINAGQSGWRLMNGDVELFITEKGGQMAPVSFYANTSNPIQPYYISPWQNEKIKKFPDPVLAPLRGDFFCMPFGGNAEPVNGEKHSCHGEVSSGRWRFKGQSRENNITMLTLEMKTTVKAGKTVKKIHLIDKHNVIYTSHVLEGYSGKMPVGHHAILAVSGEDDSAAISSSKFDLGMTNPGVFSNPDCGEYQSFDINKKFTSLCRVPMLQRNMEYDDCSLFPRRKGYDDLLQIFKKTGKTPAWAAAVFKKQGYLWFSLKDAAVLPGTVFWISNCGRHSFPWSGRNISLAIEDTCSYFANGLKDSTGSNCIEKEGFRTALKLSPDKATSINYIQGVVKVPNGFEGRISEAVFSDDAMTFVSTNGVKATAQVRYDFLKKGRF